MSLNFVLFFAHKITILDLQFHDKKWHSIKNFSTCVDMSKYCQPRQFASLRGVFCCAGVVCFAYFGFAQHKSLAMTLPQLTAGMVIASRL
jgi:hypothetical protein